MTNVKISASVWNKYTESERQLFQELIPRASGVNDIKSFITAIKKRLGSVEGVKIHKMNCIVVNGYISFWNNETKRWTDTEIKPA